MLPSLLSSLCNLVGSGNFQPKRATHLALNTGGRRGSGGSKDISGRKRLQSQRLRINPESLTPESFLHTNESRKKKKIKSPMPLA